MRKSYVYGIGAFALVSAGLLAADSWRDKAPSEWTPDEVTKILNNSPWSQEARFSGSGSEGRRGGGMGGPGMGGGGMGRGGGGMGGGGMPNGGWGGGGGGMGGSGGGMGNPGGGYGGRGGGRGDSGRGMESARVTLRWDSAEPVRQALVKQYGDSNAAAKLPADSYVIAVIGLPNRDSFRRRDEDSDSGSTAESDEQRQADRMARLKETTTLTVKGKSPFGPEKVEKAEDGSLLFYFPKSTEPLSLDDKEVEFAMRMGPMELKHSFRLKDMKYQGKLAL